MILISHQSIVLILSALTATALSVEGDHLPHNSRPSESLKEQPLLDESRFLKNFRNRYLKDVKLDNNIRQFKEQDTIKVFSYVFTQQGPIMASNVHSSSTPVDHGHGKESSYSSLSASADQEHEESSNIHSSSKPVDHGYGTESSFSYLSASNDQKHEESSNIHSFSMPVEHGYGTKSSNIHFSSTPVDHGYGKESSFSYLPASFSYLSASNDQELEESSNIHSSSTPVDHGYGTESITLLPICICSPRT
jgi:hypothetical protein